MRTRFLFLILLIFVSGAFSVSAQDAGAPANDKTKSVSSGVLNGKATNLPSPAYPAAAKAVRASGAVNVQVTIDEQGNVISASALSGHPLLRAAAVEAARAAKFTPTTLQGQPVKVTGVIVYNFVLPDNTTKSESEKLLPVGVIMFLTALKDIPGDEESKEILRDMGRALPASMTTQKALFNKLANAGSKNEEKEIIDEIVASMRKDSTGSEVWMIDLGKQWGGAIGEAFKISGSEYSRDRQKFIGNLQGMNWLLESPPKDISKESLDKIRAIAAFNDETDTISPEFINKFFKASLDFIDYMIGEKKNKA